MLACAGDRVEIEAVIAADLEPVLDELAARGAVCLGSCPPNGETVREIRAGQGVAE